MHFHVVLGAAIGPVSVVEEVAKDDGERKNSLDTGLPAAPTKLRIIPGSDASVVVKVGPQRTPQHLADGTAAQTPWSLPKHLKSSSTVTSRHRRTMSAVTAATASSSCRPQNISRSTTADTTVPTKASVAIAGSPTHGPLPPVASSSSFSCSSSEHRRTNSFGSVGNFFATHLNPKMVSKKVSRMGWRRPDRSPRTKAWSCKRCAHVNVTRVCRVCHQTLSPSRPPSVTGKPS